MNALPAPVVSTRRPRWVSTIAVGYAVLSAASVVIMLADPALLVASHAHIDDATRVYVGYTVSRTVAIVVVLVGALALHRNRILAAVLAWAALVQLLDIVVDLATGRATLVPGLLVLTALLGAAASRLSNRDPRTVLIRLRRRGHPSG